MRKTKVFLAAIITAAMMIGNLGAATVHADDDVKPVSVKITESSKSVYAGKTFELEAKMTPSNADDDDLYWAVVGKKGIVKLENDRDDDEIKVKALKPGKTIIRCHIKGTRIRDYISVYVKNPNYAFARYGSSKRTVEVGDDFELKVKKSSGLKDNYLKWYIKDRRILSFDDDDITDDEVELEAKRTGTTTVTCRNFKTGKYISYTITVVPDRDDDDRDDDDDDRDDDDDDDDDDRDDD